MAIRRSTEACETDQTTLPDAGRFARFSADRQNWMKLPPGSAW